MDTSGPGLYYRSVKWGSALGAAICSYLALAGVAVAGMAPDPRPGDTLLGKEGGFAYVSDPETVSNPDFTAARAACPDAGGEWRITGGGLVIRGPMPESTFTVTSSRPLDLLDLYGDDDDDNDDYWEGSVDAPVASTLETFAICAKSQRIKHIRLDVPDSPTADRKVALSCSERRVVGGGGFIATSNSFISSLYPAGLKRWKLSLFDFQGGIGGMESWVVCARGIDTTIRTDQVNVPPGEARTAFARCHSDEHVTGGGAKAAGAADATNLYASYPVDTGDNDDATDDAWRAGSYNRSAAPRKLKAYAICAG